jgi:ABC-type polysaccharide/polyol phosphate transport system ATPase subunit
VANTLPPTEGSVKVRGKIVPLLGLGVGFLPNLSGAENIYLNGVFMGLTEKEIKKKYDEIVEFAELGKFMKMPMKHYSSGMTSRLAFSIAVHVEPDILLIDEVLGVGDKDFNKKSAAKMRELMSKANAILIATHDTTSVQNLCNKALLLEEGKIVAFGEPGDVVKAYLSSNKKMSN